jgi:hypothetical protein
MADLDVWEMEKNDVAPLIEDYAADGVSVIGDPMSGDGILFLRNKMVHNPDALAEELRKVLTLHALAAPGMPLPVASISGVRDEE